MASKISATAALFVLLNLLFFTMVASTYVTYPPPPAHRKYPNQPGARAKYPNQPGARAKCPKSTLKLGVCAGLLKGHVDAVVGTMRKRPCCSLIDGLADLEAAACLCTAVKAKVLGLDIDVPVSLSVLLNYCGKKVPSGYQCA